MFNRKYIIHSWWVFRLVMLVFQGRGVYKGELQSRLFVMDFLPDFPHQFKFAFKQVQQKNHPSSCSAPLKIRVMLKQSKKANHVIPCTTYDFPPLTYCQIIQAGCDAKTSWHRFIRYQKRLMIDLGSMAKSDQQT